MGNDISVLALRTNIDYPVTFGAGNEELVGRILIVEILDFLKPLRKELVEYVLGLEILAAQRGLATCLIVDAVGRHVDETAFTS